MSRVSSGFLRDSILLNPAAQENLFSELTDKELVSELSTYREHVLGRWEDLEKEMLANRDRIGAYFGASLTAEPKIRQLKRASLYFDRLVIDDPLFPHSRVPTSDHGAYARFCGYAEDSLNRRAVAEAARLVARLQPLVAGGLLKLVPASFHHEPPREIGISFSPTLFSERLPTELLPWFHDRAEVFPMSRSVGSGWVVRRGDKLEPCRGIAVHLRGIDEAMAFHLTATKHEPVPGRENRLRVTQWFPSEPPDEETFRNWVTQSVNQFSGRVYRRVVADVANAIGSGTMMFTDSQFVSELLQLQLTENGGLREDLANLAMRFELPFLDNLSIADLMTIRELEGEAFQSYRLELERQLRSLRTIESDAELVRRLQEVQHEIAEVQVNQVQSEVTRLNRGLFRQAVVGLASLATVIPSQGLSLALVLHAGAKAWKYGIDDADAVRREPSYFVWRLRKQVQQRQATLPAVR